MKKLLFAFFLLTTFTTTFAQKIIKVDFKDKTIDSLNEIENLKLGELYKIEIDHVNLNLYNVVLNKKDTIYKSAVKFPTFELVNLGGIGDLLSKINLNSLSTKREDSSKIRTDIKIKNNITYDNLEIVVEKRIRKEKMELEKYYSKINKYNDEIDELNLKIQNHLLSYSVLDRTNSTFSQLNSGFTIDKILNESTAIRNNIKNLKAEIEKEKFEYLQFRTESGKVEIIAKNPKLKDADQYITDAYTKTVTDVGLVYQTINAEKVTTLLKSIILLDNNSNERFVSLPQQLNGNETQIKIQIIPAATDSNLPSYSTVLKFTQKQKFFTGMSMSFYYAGFNDEIYSTTAITTGTNTNYRLVNENNSKGETGVVSLLHFGCKPWINNATNLKDLALNIVIGPALALTKNVRPRVAVGGGLSYGRKNMITLNALYMAGYIDKKSTAYDLNTDYSVAPTNITVSKLAGSFALSLGYIYEF
ncbi:hypothetical protein SAMN05421789_101241 [Kaistella chaponensis]|uniref:Outer membrane protein with beta-barrel domain n=1 Tax=Kaistella chaponensis TaxID=713588 RepID=A0A1N7J8L1_9FLAO|nr:hypothetical protein [Kaistella chaponensis]SIS45591.1 hypothetical protein SAMN05421789_101241 [Kaistella chaponensis]